MARRTTVVLVVAIAGALLLGVLASIGAAGPSKAGDSKSNRLIGYQEVPPNSTPARGTIEIRIDEDDDEINYRLTFSNLIGTVTQAHIHFAQLSVNGGITAWLCETGTNASPVDSTPACPMPGGSVTGTIRPGDIAPNAQAVGQGIAAGDFDEVVDALREGVTYANVHSSTFGGGEIRAQIKSRGGNDDD